MPWLSRITNL